MKETYFPPLLRHILVLAAFLLFWEAAAFLFPAKPNPLPPPSSFLSDIGSNGFSIGIGSQATNVFSAVGASVFRVIVGLLLAVLFGIPIGLLISEFKSARAVLLPLVQLLAPIAPIAWIPIVLAVLGVGNQTAVTIVFLGVFFLFVLTVANSAGSVSKDIRDSALILGIQGLHFYQKIMVPAIAPDIVRSMRINFPAAWMAVLAAEMTGLRDGLGAIVMTGRNLYDYDVVMFGVFFIAIIGMLFDVAISTLHEKFFWW